MSRDARFVDRGASPRHGGAYAYTMRSVARSPGAGDSGLRKQRRHAVHAHDTRRGRLQHAGAGGRSDAPARGGRGTPLTPEDTTDSWSRGCEWQGSGGMAITLLIDGALTSNGQLVLSTTVDAHSSSTTQATPVSGLGDKAVYLVNQGLGQILNAMKGSTVVSLAVYNFTPAVPETSMQPLVVEALGQL